MRRRVTGGFTLIELLVVIAVMAVLAAILFPVFAQAREKARQATCLANLRQIGAATLMYAQDYDETLLWNPPHGGTPGSVLSKAFHRYCSDQPTISFLVLLQPYLKSAAVFRCPSSKGYPADVYHHENYLRSLDLRIYGGVGYGFNEPLFAHPCAPRGLASLKHAASEVALFGDSLDPWASYAYDVQEDGEHVSYWARSDGTPPFSGATDGQSAGRPRHQGGIDFVYADGRACFGRPLVTNAPGGPQVPGSRIWGYYPQAKLE
jgi:prepilin-type N-terminal cleavage/methylation domain-containing protein